MSVTIKKTIRFHNSNNFEEILEASKVTVSTHMFPFFLMNFFPDKSFDSEIMLRERKDRKKL